MNLGMYSFTQQIARGFGIQGFMRLSFFLLLTSGAASDCGEKAKPATPIEQALQKSSDPLVRFVVLPSQAAAAQVLAQSASELIDEPILARLAFSTLCAPSEAQAGRFRASIRGNAFSHLAQISASSTPDVIDELIRRTQFGSDWDDGFSTLITRLERALATVPIGLIATNTLDGDAASLQKLDQAERETALENTRWIAAHAYAAAFGLPRFEFLSRACRGKQLDATAERRALCTSLGEGLESKSSSLISVLTGVSILKNLGGNDDEIVALSAKYKIWSFLHLSLVPEKLPADASIEARVAALAAENTHIRRQIEIGEVNAAIATYTKSGYANPKVLALLRAVRE